MVTRAGSRAPPWIALSGMRTKLPSSAEGKDGEVGTLAAHVPFAVEGMSRRVCACLWHLCLKEFGRHSGLQHVSCQQVAVMAADEALLALDYIKAIANTISFPQG